MQGVRATTAPYVLFLTPDTSLPEPYAVAKLRDALERDSGAALAGPLLFDEQGRDLLNGSYSLPSVSWVVLTSLGLGRRLRLLERPPPKSDPAVVSASVPVALLNGACMLARRSALETVGGLDERYRLYYEEVDLARRLGGAGFRILLVPGVRAVHRGKGSPAAPGLREAAYAHGERIYFRTHHGRGGELAVRAARAIGRSRSRVPA
jgi:GT2 family glycosyltransferase